MAIGGRVTGRGGAALVGAVVALEPQPTGAVRRVSTDAGGMFRFTDASSGAHRLRVTYGKTEASGLIDAPPGQDYNIDVELEIDPAWLTP